MIAQSIRKVARELENLTRQSISVERALDLLEAATYNLEDLIAINTMRESMLEIELHELVKNPEITSGPLYYDSETSVLLA